MKDSQRMSRRNFLGQLGLAGALVLVPSLADASTGERNNQLNVSDVLYGDKEPEKRVIMDVNEREIYEIHKEEEKEKLRKQKEAEETAYNEKHNPKAIPVGTGSPRLELARVIYGEGRGQYYDAGFLRTLGDTVLTRAKNAGLLEFGEQGILPVIFDRVEYPSGKVRYQYSCFNPGNPNLDDVKNPSAIKEWEKCYKIAGEALEKGIKNKVSHYWTEPYADEPNWASGEMPALVFSHKIGNGRESITRFYNLLRHPGEYKPRISLEDISGDR